VWLIAAVLVLPFLTPPAASAMAAWSARDPPPWSQARLHPVTVFDTRRAVSFTFGGLVYVPYVRLEPFRAVGDSGYIRFDPDDCSGPRYGRFASKRARCS